MQNRTNLVIGYWRCQILSYGCH